MHETIDYEELYRRTGSTKNAAAELGISKSAMRKRLVKAGVLPLRTESAPVRRAPKSTPAAPVGGISEEDLRLRHSPVDQIRAAAESLVGSDHFLQQSEFIQKSGVRGPYRHIVEQAEFRQFWGTASGGVVYWGDPKRIAALKAEGILR